MPFTGSHRQCTVYVTAIVIAITSATYSIGIVLQSQLLLETRVFVEFGVHVYFPFATWTANPLSCT